MVLPVLRRSFAAQLCCMAARTTVFLPLSSTGLITLVWCGYGLRFLRLRISDGQLFTIANW